MMRSLAQEPLERALVLVRSFLDSPTALPSISAPTPPNTYLYSFLYAFLHRTFRSHIFFGCACPSTTSSTIPPVTVPSMTVTSLNSLLKAFLDSVMCSFHDLKAC